MAEPWTRYTHSFGFLGKALLGYLAYITIFPFWLTALIHKLRGVRIDNCRTVYIAANVVVDSLYPELVTIENGVYITRGCKILSHINPTVGIARFWGCDSVKKPVVIKEDAFLGVNTIVVPGVRVGRCSLVAAGAVVTRDVPDYAMVAGNPAVIIGDVRDCRP